MNQNKMKAREAHTSLRRLCALGVFCALALLCTMVLHIHVSFLTFDAKDAVITVTAILYGPASGVMVSAVVALLEMLLISDTGFYGLLMNLLSSVTFSVVASLCYRRVRTMRGACLSLGAAILSTTAVMLGANLLITPLYTHSDIEAVRALIPGLLLPFNLIKTALNAALVLMLYKPFQRALVRCRLLPVREDAEHDHGADSSEAAERRRRNTRLAWILGSAVLLLCVILYLTVMNGSVSWFS